jgi:hypothetical protein
MSGKSASIDIQNKCKDLARQGCSLTEVSRQLKIHRETARKYCIEERDAYLKAHPDPKSSLSQPNLIQDEMARIASRRDMRLEKEVLMAVAGEKSLRYFLENLIREVAPRFNSIATPPLIKTGTETSKESILFVFSDWHGFESVSAERTMGFNEFNGPILAERVTRIVNAGLSIKKRAEKGKGWYFPDAHIALNGDFVSGTIHETERHSDSPNVVHSVFAVATLLASALHEIARQFPNVYVYGTPGNHGRFPDQKRVHHKDPTRNWDYLIYLFAMEKLQNIKNIKWKLPNSYFCQYEIEGWSFLQNHGHDIKQWNNLPHYGIDRFSRNTNALFSSRK